MTNTNAIVKQTPIGSIDDLSRVAKMLAISNYFDAKGDGNVAIAQIATKIMAGQEMGYGPFASVQGIHVIKGRPTLSANLMAAAVKAHPKYDYRVRKMEDSEVVIEFFEGSESLGVSSFTIEEARKAETQNLTKFPRNMLFARAMSNGVKWYCPDVFNGNTVYTPDEFDVTVDSNTDTVIYDGRNIDVKTGEILATVTPPATNGNGAAHRQPSPEVKELAASVNATITKVESFDDIPNATASDEEFASRVTNIAAGFSSPPAAQAWAIQNKYCSNEHHARNRWLQIVEKKFNNKLDQRNMKAVILAYVADCLSKPKVQIEQPEAA
jgi:hypothetical protein